MLTPEEMNAIFDRLLAGQVTEADIDALRLELQQGKYRIEAEQLNANEIHIGDRIYQGADAETIKAVLQSALGEQQKILEQQKAKRPRTERDFLGMMKAEVVDSLKQSLHHAVLMNLGKEEQPEQVERLWDAKIKVADQPNVLLPNDTKTIEIFDREDIAGRLLILGSPGSGKTTTLLELAKALIERAEMEQDFPMPVLFNLSSWKDDKQPLHEWMVQELKLRVRSDITRTWLDNHKLLPLLDGLDEMAFDRQETCVEAINQQLLTGEKSLPYLVVCSRNEEYDNYETKLLLNGAISIQALTINKIRSYLNSTDQSALCHALDRDPALLALVRTPLFLSIAALSFQELSQERWQTLTTTEARVEYLLDSYIRQMLERPIPHNMFGKWQLPSNQKTRQWLIWLAQQMQKEAQSEFLIEKIQPSLLASSRLRAYKLGTGLMSGIVFGSIFFCFFGFNGFDVSNFSTSTNILYTLRDGLMFAITSALACSISNAMRPFDSRRVRVEVKYRALSGLIFGVLFSFYYWFSYNSNPILIENIKTSSKNSNASVSQIFLWTIVMFGLIAGITGFLIKGLEAKITTVESLRWSWKKAKNRFATGIKYNFIIASIIVSVGGVINILTVELPSATTFMDLLLLIFSELRSVTAIFSIGLSIVTIITLISGLEGKDVEHKLLPNQGIKRSLIVSVASGFIGGVIYLLLLGLNILLSRSLGVSKTGIINTNTSPLLVAIFCLFSLTFLVILFSVPILVRVRGGSACIQHCVLRLILHHSGYIPWNYARFLNYCTERSLLQRIGGRYRFIHRLLQEHFAAMPFDGIEGDRQRSTL